MSSCLNITGLPQNFFYQYFQSWKQAAPVLEKHKWDSIQLVNWAWAFTAVQAVRLKLPQLWLVRLATCYTYLGIFCWFLLHTNLMNGWTPLIGLAFLSSLHRHQRFHSLLAWENTGDASTSAGMMAFHRTLTHGPNRGKRWQKQTVMHLWYYYSHSLYTIFSIYIYKWYMYIILHNLHSCRP